MTRGQRRLLNSTIGLCSRAVASPKGRTCILCYHAVQPEPQVNSTTVARFGEQMAWLHEHCDIVPLAEITAASAGDRPRVAVTFDDGHLNNHEFALPALAKWRVPATLFLTAGYIERDKATMARFQFFHRDRWTPEPLGWSHILEMLAAGIRMGAHTYSHSNLRLLNDAQLRHELNDTRKLLEDRLGRAVTEFAYPFGKPRAHFDRRAVRIVERAGYEMAVTMVLRGIRARDKRWLLPRIAVGDDSTDRLERKIRGEMDLIGYCNELSPRWLDRILFPNGYKPSTYHQ